MYDRGAALLEGDRYQYRQSCFYCAYWFIGVLFYVDGSQYRGIVGKICAVHCV